MFDQKYENPYIRLNRLFVTINNIIPALDVEGVPPEIDLLSIDIDGMDYHIWKTISHRVNARVVVMEVKCLHFQYGYNQSMRNDYVSPYEDQFLWRFGGRKLTGASAESMVRLADTLGYLPVWLYHEDLIFVRKDILEHVYDRTGVRLLTDLHLLIDRERERFAKDGTLGTYGEVEIVGYDSEGRPNIQPLPEERMTEFQRTGVHRPRA